MMKFLKILANRLKRLKGEWVMDEDGFPYCNKCGLYPDFTTDFCPHCGADMRTKYVGVHKTSNRGRKRWCGMRKTLYSTIIGNKENTYWYGDKLLRIAFIITHTVELALIIYLLVK